MMKSKLASCLVSAAFAAACGSSGPTSDPAPSTGLASNTAVLAEHNAPPVAPVVASAVPTTDTKPAAAMSAAPAASARSVTYSGVQLAPEIATACKVDPPKAYFEFDSANIKESDMSELDSVAKCISTGALKGKKVEVVGHADARGDAEYNKALSRTRAESVADYLGTKGVDKAKMKVVPKGEEKASGETLVGMAFDRRVDIRLAKLASFRGGGGRGANAYATTHPSTSAVGRSLLASAGRNGNAGR